MKHLVMLLLLVAMKFYAQAQENFLGSNKSELQATLSKYEIVMQGTTDDQKFTFIVQKLTERLHVALYFDSDNTCTTVVEIHLSNGSLFDEIADLNKRYAKVDENRWINKSNTVKIELKKGDTGYTVMYSVI